MTAKKFEVRWEGELPGRPQDVLGVRSADALYRVYGREAWGAPLSVAHHLFCGEVDKAASERAWSRWLDGVLATEAVA